MFNSSGEDTKNTVSFAAILSTDLVDPAFCITRENLHNEAERVSELSERFDEPREVNENESFFNEYQTAQIEIVRTRGVDTFGVNLVFQNINDQIFYVNEEGQIMVNASELYAKHESAPLQSSPEFVHFIYGPWQFVGKLEDL